MAAAIRTSRSQSRVVGLAFTVDSITQSAFRVNTSCADFTENLGKHWLKLGSQRAGFRHAKSRQCHTRNHSEEPES